MQRVPSLVFLVAFLASACSDEGDPGGAGKGGTSTGGSGAKGGSTGGAGTGTGGTGTSTGGTGTGGTGTGTGGTGTGTGGTGTGTGGTGTGTGGTGTGGTGTGGTGTGTGGSAGTAGAGGSSAIPGGGTILFEEDFDDSSFQARGWYDGPSGTISTSERAPGSASSFECRFDQGATGCSAGKLSRHAMTATASAYFSFWIKFSPNWVGSGRAYHPHMFHFINDLDSDFVGPSHTFLTTYMEVVNGRAMLALQDSKNVDLACILRNNDTFVGCSGDFASYVFDENRSVCACNGLVGDVDGRDCFSSGTNTWYSSRAWYGANAFVDAAGPSYKADWHFVEVYFQMNSIQGGVGVPDGKIRWVQDGRTLISSDAVLMRTNAHANLMFDQFAMLPYIGDGSPVVQSFWVDDMTVATARP